MTTDSGSPKNDPLGDRMKAYEFVTRSYLPRRTYTLVRVDGRAFHSFTRGMARPYDARLARSIDWVGKVLCTKIAGARLAYCQSDEVSVLLTDFQALNTEPFFSGNLQKICSTAAALATGAFLSRYPEAMLDDFPTFDARVWTIPDPVEVENYFIWRQQDATRNSISMLGQAHFSHRELHQVSTADIQDKLVNEKGINWNDQEVGFKRGRTVVRLPHTIEVDGVEVSRNMWEVQEPPVFTQDREYLSSLIPRYE